MTFAAAGRPDASLGARQGRRDRRKRWNARHPSRWRRSGVSGGMLDAAASGARRCGGGGLGYGSRPGGRPRHAREADAGPAARRRGADGAAAAGAPRARRAASGSAARSSFFLSSSSRPVGRRSRAGQAALPGDERAAVRDGDVPGDGEAEAGAAGVAGPRLVEPGEPVEHDSRCSPGSPAVVDHLQGGAWRPPPADGDRGRVPYGVVDQVGHHPGEVRAGAATTTSGATSSVPRPPPRRSRGLLGATWPRSTPRRRRFAARRARASSSRSAAGRWMRSTSASASGRTVGRNARRPSSSRVRRVASGLRSSCAASATNRLCRSTARLQPVERGVHGAGQRGRPRRLVRARAPARCRSLRGDVGELRPDRRDRGERAPDQGPGQPATSSSSAGRRRAAATAAPRARPASCAERGARPATRAVVVGR